MSGNRLEVEAPPMWSLAQTIRGSASRRGDAPALTYGDQVMTFNDLDRRSSQVGQGLLGEGIKAGDRIAFLDKNSPEFFEVLFGGGKMGAVCVSVNWRLSPREMQYIVHDSGARILFVGREFLPQLEEMEPGLTAVEKVLVVGEADGRQSYAAWRDAQVSDDPGYAPRPEDIALQLYTSGTTGMPKGALLSNANLARLPTVGDRWRFDEDSTNLVAMPLFHIGGCGWALIGFWLGCNSVLLREFIPDQALEVIEQQRITNAFLVPAVLHFLTSVPGAEDHDFSALRAIVYGASPITDDHLRKSMETFHCDFIQVYGLTETTGAITELPFADHDASGPRAGLLRSAGKPYPWVELRIVDPASGNDMPAGEVGEVWSRSSQNMSGYWNQPDETAHAFSDGWFKTGDAGYLDEDGYLFLTDRVKDMIDSGGENIYPIEVENVLSGHPEIADVAVIGVPDDKWGESVKAIVVPGPGTKPDPAEIIAFARRSLAGFKVPASIDFVDALPRNPSGKILKKVLREPYWEGRDRRIN